MSEIVEIDLMQIQSAVQIGKNVYKNVLYYLSLYIFLFAKNS